MEVRKKKEKEYKTCEFCQARMPADFVSDVCPNCAERILFAQVRAFIRSGDYNEYEVAKAFDIPLKKVKDWIKEGRIEYKDTPGKKLMSTKGKCVICGNPSISGDICIECEKKLRVRGFGLGNYKYENGEIRFIKHDESKGISRKDKD